MLFYLDLHAAIFFECIYEIANHQKTGNIIFLMKSAIKKILSCHKNRTGNCTTQTQRIYFTFLRVKEFQIQIKHGITNGLIKFEF